MHHEIFFYRLLYVTFIRVHRGGGGSPSAKFLGPPSLALLKKKEKNWLQSRHIFYLFGGFRLFFAKMALFPPRWLFFPSRWLFFRENGSFSAKMALFPSRWLFFRENGSFSAKMAPFSAKMELFPPKRRILPPFGVLFLVLHL